MLVECECCGKEISEDSSHCIYCGHPMKEQNDLLFAYQYKGKILNCPLFHDDISKLDILQKVKKIEVYDKVYKITDIICSAHNETIYVILDDIE